MLRSSVGVGIGWVGIAMLADGIPSLLLPHRLLEAGRTDATTLGLTTLIAILVAAAIQPAAGRLSDRAGRGPVIVAGTIMAAVGLALLLGPGTAVAGAVVSLCGVSVAQAGYQPLLPDRIAAGWRGRASGMKSLFDVGGAMLGFVMLAALIGAGRPDLAAATLAGGLVMGFVVAAPLLRASPDDGRQAREVDGRAALEWPFVWLVVARFLFLLGIYVVGRFMLTFLADRSGLDADAAGAQAGTALAVLALVTVLASLPCGWLADRLGRRPLMLAGGILTAAGIALMPATDALGPVLAVGGMLSVGSAAFGSASWAMLADLTAGRDAGRLLGIANLGTAGAAAGAGAFGLLIDAAGYGFAFLLAAACALAGGAIAWRLHASDAGAPVLAGSAEAAG